MNFILAAYLIFCKKIPQKLWGNFFCYVNKNEKANKNEKTLKKLKNKKQTIILKKGNIHEIKYKNMVNAQNRQIRITNNN